MEDFIVACIADTKLLVHRLGDLKVLGRIVGFQLICVYLVESLNVTSQPHQNYDNNYFDIMHGY